ncbi:MAG: hypothetical protein ACRDNF_08470 [Streptosporangiaceae bacterium]
MPEHLEFPRPWRLMRTAGWNLAESAALPFGAYLAFDAIAGRAAGVLAGLGAVWLAVGARKLTTGRVPGLLMISALLMCVQAALVLATGQVWIYLLQFPLAKLMLAALFARTARSDRPLVAVLASEVVALRHHGTANPRIHRYFQHATWLWAVIFGVLGVAFAVLVATEPIAMFLIVSSIATVALVGSGAGFSALWFFAVARRCGLRLRFAAAS